MGWRGGLKVALLSCCLSIAVCKAQVIGKGGGGGGGGGEHVQGQRMGNYMCSQKRFTEELFSFCASVLFVTKASYARAA